MLSEPGSTPIATEMSCTSCEASTASESTSQVFRIFPRNGRMAWYSRFLACLALPPAESPSTRNSSVIDRSWLVQSASLPGSAGPEVTFLRATLRLFFMRCCAFSIASLAISSPSPTFWFSHRLKASLTIPDTKVAAAREDSRSLVWPLNCGSARRSERMKPMRSQISSGASLTPLGSKLCNSQNSRNDSTSPVRKPLTCVPPWAVGIRLT